MVVHSKSVHDLVQTGGHTFGEWDSFQWSHYWGEGARYQRNSAADWRGQWNLQGFGCAGSWTGVSNWLANIDFFHFVLRYIFWEFSWNQFLFYDFLITFVQMTLVQMLRAPMLPLHKLLRNLPKQPRSKNLIHLW